MDMFQNMSGGYNNSLMKCHLRADEALDDVIVVRIYGGTVDYVHTSRTREVMAMQVTGAGLKTIPDSKVLWANIGPTWGRQDPGGPHVGHMNLAIWDEIFHDTTEEIAPM